MSSRIALVLVVILTAAAGARPSAQRVEASASVGFTASEGVNTDNLPILDLVFDSIAPESGVSFNFTFGVNFTDNLQGEFLWARQSSLLKADGPINDLDVADMSISNYMGNLVYSFGFRDSRIRPYIFGGLGATQYSFGDPLNPMGRGIDSETRFASNWGGGVKFYFSEAVGAKVGVRWTPTYIKSDPAGVWCDPWYGCWQLVDDEYSNQFDTSVGITVRF